jgi:hypothetical protein
MKIKLAALLALSFIALLQTAPAATAQDVPELNWERGQQQSITLGGQTSSKLWSIRLAGSGNTLEFDRSSISKNGFIVYSVEIPADFKVGRYQVIVSGPDSVETTTANVNILEIISYDPLSDPKGVAVIAVIAFTLLSFFSGNREEQENQDSNEESSDDASSLGSIDTNYQGIDLKNRGKGDRRGLGKSGLNHKLDLLRHSLVFDFSSRSPLITRVFSDGSYIQSLFGTFALALPIFGAGLGAWIAMSTDLKSSLVPISVVLMLSIIVIGILDSLAGVFAVISFGMVATVQGAITTASDIRTFLGLSLLWFTPILAAGATRPLRRAKKDWNLWERTSDILIATILTGWAIKAMVLALDGFAKQRTPIATHADEIALIGAAVISLRYLIEEFTSRYAPQRVEYLSPGKLKNQDTESFLFALATKTFIFIFFMYGFFGMTWQIFAATFALVIPSLLKRFDSKLPNFSWLWQLIPGGIPSIVFMSLIGYAFGNWVNSLPLLSDDKTKTIVVLTSIPGFVIGLLKLFGRSPKNGDIRWYRRDKFKPLYRIGGPCMLLITGLITAGVLP